MSDSVPKPRIIRKANPPRYYYNHRKYLEYLRQDFEDRCAYSMQHWKRAGGMGAMDIDHFNPKLRKEARNRYENLYLATRHCNGHKWKTWPSRAEWELGIRFLDPCKETDYGLHIFEDPDTFELWGATVAGRFHIRVLDLNAEHFIEERKARHCLHRLWGTTGVFWFKGRPGIDEPEALLGIQEARRQLDLMIKVIPQAKKPSGADGK